MRRTLVVPALRCVELEVLRPSDQRWLWMSTAGGAALGAAIALAIEPAFALGGAIAGSGAGAVLDDLRRKLRLGPRLTRLEEARSMDIVPWGLVVDPGAAQHPIPWPAMQDVGCARRVLERRKYDDYERVAYDLTFTTAARVMRGTAQEQETLLVLPDLVPAYARAAARPVALDLEDAPRAARITSAPAEGQPAWAGAFADLRARVQALLQDPSFAALLTVPGGDYRSARRPEATPELVARIRRALAEDEDRLERAPLAALLAAELGLTDVMPELLDLVLSPHPLVSAVGRGAARRLGSPPLRTGALREVAPFLPDADLRFIEEWAEGPGAARPRSPAP